MGIKHKAVKAIGEEGHATEWNDEHKIDSDVDYAGHSGVNLGEPVSPSDIATKNYVDSKVMGVLSYIKEDATTRNQVLNGNTFVNVHDYGNFNIEKTTSLILSVKGTITSNTVENPPLSGLRWKITINGDIFYSEEFNVDAYGLSWDTDITVTSLNVPLFEPGIVNVTLQGREWSGGTRRVYYKNAQIILLYQ